jgi:hypothetical protein
MFFDLMWLIHFFKLSFSLTVKIIIQKIYLLKNQLNLNFFLVVLNSFQYYVKKGYTHLIQFIKISYGISQKYKKILL